jgi:hypothetical protein
MSKYRTLLPKSKYYIPKEDYLTAIHYSLRYPLWVAEVEDARDTATAIRYDKDKIQTSPSGDMVYNAATRAIELSKKVEMIDSLIQQCAKSSVMEYYLRLGVCHGLTFTQLKQRDMPCERTAYYQMRQHYYYELSRLI